VPAVVYGLGEESVSVTVSERDLRHILAGESGSNTLITLKVGSNSQMTLARQIQRHPIKGTVMHVDFVRVRADQTIQAEIPVHLTGESEGAGRGGVLEQMIHTLTIEALPGDLPPSCEHDGTVLEIGDAVRVGEPAIPTGVTVLQEADEIVVQVSAPRVVEEEAPAEGEEVAAEGAAPAPAAEGESAGGE
jgi:large subunit ribosomal protein L25